jgi:Kef-type K+ transport system membrane component KefB
VNVAATSAETAQATTAMLESAAIMLAAALVFVTLFRRLKLGATLGYIVAGALIGPHLLGLIQDPAQLLSIADIGIALLLFIIGLELRPARLWRLRNDIFGLGLAQVVRAGLRSACCCTLPSACRPRLRSRSDFRSACPRPRRFCRCSARTTS